MNDENLIPMSRRSESERRELGRKGGKKSGEKRRENRMISDAMALVMSLPVIDDEAKEVMSLLSIKDEKKNLATQIALAQAFKAKDGDTYAAQYCAERNGESIKHLELELRYAELEEKKRSNKAKEKLERERIKAMQKVADGSMEKYMENLMQLMKQGASQGLGEDD